MLVSSVYSHEYKMCKTHDIINSDFLWVGGIAKIYCINNILYFIYYKEFTPLYGKDKKLINCKCK